MKNYKSVRVITEKDPSIFSKRVVEAIENNDDNKFETEIHYSLNGTVFSAMILGYK